jgi:hypothetical protein
MIVSSADAIGAFNTGFDTENLHRRTWVPPSSSSVTSWSVCSHCVGAIVEFESKT